MSLLAPLATIQKHRLFSPAMDSTALELFSVACLAYERSLFFFCPSSRLSPLLFSASNRKQSSFMWPFFLQKKHSMSDFSSQHCATSCTHSHHRMIHDRIAPSDARSRPRVSIGPARLSSPHLVYFPALWPSRSRSRANSSGSADSPKGGNRGSFSLPKRVAGSKM